MLYPRPEQKKKQPINRRQGELNGFKVLK